MAMTEKERLLHTLFANDKVKRKNIKFMRGDRQDVTEEDFCREVNSAFMQKISGIVSNTPEVHQSDKKVNIREFVSALI